MSDDQIGLLDRDHLRYLDKIVWAKLDRYARKVVWHIKRLPENCRQSGDDSELDTVWEEYKDQVQGEHSIYYAIYEDVISAICNKVVSALPPDEQRLCWLWSDDFVEWETDAGVLPPDEQLKQAVAYELLSRVQGLAANEELRHDSDYT